MEIIELAGFSWYLDNLYASRQRAMAILSDTTKNLQL